MWLLSFRFVSRILGVVLVLAGGSTAYDAFDTARAFGMVPWLSAAGGAAEMAFGLWLVVGLHPRLAWWLLVGCFITLLAVSFDRAVAGESSCACFGRFHVNPWYTVAFDAAAILALALFQPSGKQAMNPVSAKRRWAVYASLLLVAFVGLGASTYRPKSQLGDDGEIIGQGEDVFLAPGDWVGRRFPLAPHIDVGPVLMHGRWALMFYHPDCSLCRTAIPEFVGLAHHLDSQDISTRVALIEVPREDSFPAPLSREGLCVRGSLSAERRWRIKTPTFLVLDGGIVTKVPEELNSLYREFGIPGGGDDQSGGGPFPDYRRIRRQLFLRQIACGPMALIKIMDALGKPLSEDEAEKLVDEAGEKGIDMLRLKELAEQHGLYALGVTVTLDKLRQMGERAIVYMDTAGFVPVLGFTKDGVIVAYPLSAPGVLPDDLFAKSFGDEGKALLVSDKPLGLARLGLSSPDEERPQGPRLTPGRTVMAIGRLHRKNFEASLTLANDGSEPLHIKEIKTTCPCFTATVDCKTLAPGESTQLRAKGTQDNLGPFNYAVLIETNQTEASPARIPVRGYLEPPVAFGPPAVFLRELLPDEKADTEVEVDLPRYTRFSTLKLTVPKQGALTAELIRREPGAGVTLRWAGAKQPGIYRGELEIRAGNAKDAVGATLPWAIEVVPAITAFPPSFWIDAAPGVPWTRHLSIESRRDFVGTPSLHWSDEAEAKPIHTTVSKVNAHSLRVNLSGKVPVSAEQITLTVVIGDQSVSVPLRFVQGRE